MEQINEYLKYLHIDPIIFLIVFASGFFVDRMFKGIVIFKEKRTDMAWKTLIVSFAVSVLYFYLNGTPKDMYAELFLSYFVATSLYELLVRPFSKWLSKKVKKITGDEEIES